MSAFARATIFAIALFCVWVTAHAQSSLREPKDATASISGRVTVGGKAAPGIAVILSVAEVSPIRPPGVKVTTDEDGRYRLTGVAAGRYNVAPYAPALSVANEGPLRQSSKMVAVAEGEIIEGIDFSLTRGGVITGRVTDADGKPVAGQFVNLLQVDERSQKSTPVRFNFYMHETDDRGIYRLYGLAPGRYMVNVGDSAESGVIRMGGAANYYPRTFHPNVTEESQATVLEVTAGGEVSGVDISIARATKTYTASGRIVDAETGEPLANLMYGHGSVRGEQQRSIGAFGFSNNRTNENGEFRIEGLAPGQFAAFIVSQEETEFYSPPAIFEVKGEDVTGLEIKAHRGSSISGFAAIEGTNDPDALARLGQLELGVFVMSQELSVPRLTRIKIGPDGSFRIAGLQPGKARISLGGFPRPKGFSILRVERDGVDQSAGIEVGRGEHITDVRVTIAYGNNIVRGTIVIEGGELPAGSRLSVTARPAGGGTQSVASAEADARRRFVLEGLGIGEYEITLRVMPGRPPGAGGGIAPTPAFPSVKQIVNVTQGAEAEVTIVLNLSAKDKDG